MFRASLPSLRSFLEIICPIKGRISFDPAFCHTNINYATKFITLFVASSYLCSRFFPNLLIPLGALLREISLRSYPLFFIINATFRVARRNIAIIKKNVKISATRVAQMNYTRPCARGRKFVDTKLWFYDHRGLWSINRTRFKTNPNFVPFDFLFLTETEEKSRSFGG